MPTAARLPEELASPFLLTSENHTGQTSRHSEPAAAKAAYTTSSKASKLLFLETDMRAQTAYLGPLPTPPIDPVVSHLREFFQKNEIWRTAADFLSGASSSQVTFSHLPAEEWRLVRRGGHTVLEPGRAEDPDLVFHFTPGAVERITQVDGDMANFAIALFDAALDDDPGRNLGLEVVAPFSRLARRGYLRLLWAGGGPLLAFGANHGIRTIGQLRDLVASVRRGT